MYDPGSAQPARAGITVATAGGGGQPVMPAWLSTLNNILKKLGHDGRLTVMTTAVAVFPPARA